MDEEKSCGTCILDFVDCTPAQAMRCLQDKNSRWRNESQVELIMAKRKEIMEKMEDRGAIQLPDGEVVRKNRRRWPKNSTPVAIQIVYEGLVFTVAKASIIVGRDRTLIEAEGISRLSPLDDPDRNNPIQGTESAISQAISALHTRVMKHRRSFHHYRG